MAGHEFAAGDVVAGQFRVLQPLKQGGMGALYIAEQLGTGYQRALKVMHPQFAADPKSRERFEQEARIGSRIESEHVVQVVAAGIDPTRGTPWLAMELLKGDDLSVVMERRGRLPQGEVLAVYRQLCHALAAAHRVGVVHRDLKPENIFMAESRRSDAAFTVKVLDFGIAKWIHENRTAATATAIIGSPLWMAPEQLETGARVRPATDVWALGLIAFYLLTGRRYWRAANGPEFSLPGLVREIVMPVTESASERARALGVDAFLPPGFDAWFARTTALQSEERFPEAGAALAALEPLLGGALGATRAAPGPVVNAMPRTEVWSGTPVAAPPPTTTSPVAAVAPPAAPRRTALWAVLALVVLGAGGAAIALAGRGSAGGTGGDGARQAQGGLNCTAEQHASEGHCCAAGEEWVGARQSCVCLAPGGCGAGASANTSGGSSATGSAGATTTGPGPVAVQSPPPPPPPPHACSGTWSGAMHDRFGGAGGAAVEVHDPSGGASCGTMTERWGTRVCRFELRDCEGAGPALHVLGATTSHGCSGARIDLSCTADSMTLREVPTDTPQDVATGALRRGSAPQ